MLSPRRRDAVGLGSAVVAWVAALVLVAAAGKAVVVQRVDRSTPAPTAAGEAPPAGRPPATVALPNIGPYLHLEVPVATTAPATTATTAPPFDLGVSDPLAPTSPLSSLLPKLPVITLPPLPPALAPLVAVAGPSVRQVCSEVGTAVVISALVKGDLESAGIPVTQALTYLGPVLSACALFPPGEPSICAVDTALNTALIPEDLRILVGVPALAGLGLDQVASVEHLLAATGLPLDGTVSGSLAKALGCATA